MNNGFAAAILQIPRTSATCEQIPDRGPFAPIFLAIR